MSPQTRFSATCRLWAGLVANDAVEFLESLNTFRTYTKCTFDIREDNTVEHSLSEKCKTQSESAGPGRF